MAIRQLIHIAALDVFDVHVVVFKIMEDEPNNQAHQSRQCMPRATRPLAESTT